MNKRFISVIISMVLVMALLSGCGSGAKEPEGLSGEVSGAITVSCYDAMSYKGFLEYAAQKFEDKYPGTTVNVETAGSMPEIKTQESDNMFIAVAQNTDNQQAHDDYISKINTELMSGKGADVIALDILPYYKYADNGQLVDLSVYMKEDRDFNTADFAGNIFNGAKYKNGQYLFPLDYTFDYFAYDSSLDPSFPAQDKLTFTEAIEAVADKSQASGNKIFALTSYSEQQKGANLFSAMFTQGYDQFIDLANRKANLADGSFAGLLQTVQDYADKGYIQPYGATSIRSDGTLDMSAFQQNRQEKYYLKKNMNLSLLNLFTRNLGQNARVMVEGSGGGDVSNDEIAGLVANEKGEVQFSYYHGFGINSNSENKRTAWEFIKFLASEEMQSSGLAMPFAIPVNNEARTALATMSITGEAMRQQVGLINPGGGNRPPGKSDAKALTPEQQVPKEQITGEQTPEQQTATELTPEQQTALSDYTQTLDRFTGQLNKLIIRDDKIDDMIYQEAGYFFSGEKSADEVANVLQNKISLYLNE